MAVVSDTGPINYLVQLGRTDLLPALFDRIIISPGVMAELKDPGAPQVVVSWLKQSPQWLDVLSSSEALPTLRSDEGEYSVIALAKQLACPLLCDDLTARRIARAEGIAVSGTLGVLQQAHARGWVEIREDLDRLVETTNFHVTEALIAQVVEGAQQMRAARKS